LFGIPLKFNIAGKQNVPSGGGLALTILMFMIVGANYYLQQMKWDVDGTEKSMAFIKIQGHLFSRFKELIILLKGLLFLNGFLIIKKI
jgi:hypothetical protein